MMKNPMKRNKDETRNHTLPKSLSNAFRKSKARNIRVGEECMNNMESYKDEDVLIFYTGGGCKGTITKSTWHVFEYTNHQQELCGY